jgi:hypothetical protein
MEEHIEFGKVDFQMLVDLNNGHKSNVDRLDKLETENAEQRKEINQLRGIIQNMLWASSKVALVAGSGFAGLMAIGYWLADALHFRAVEAFFKTLRGE